MDKKITRTLLCILCALLLCSYSVLTPVAEALTATMSLSLAVTALAVLIISSIGVTITAPSGQDVTDYVGGRLQTWVSSQGYNDVGSWFTGTTGITLASYIAHVFSGALAVGKLVYDALKSFINYFVSTEGIVAGGQPVGQVPTSVSPTVSTSQYVHNPLTVTATSDTVLHVQSNNMYTNNSDYRTSGCVFCTPIDSSASSVTFSLSNWTSSPNYGVNLYPFLSNSTALGYYGNQSTFAAQNGNSRTFQNPNHYQYLCFGVYVNANYGQVYSFDLTVSNQDFVNDGGAVFAPDTNILDLPALTDDQSYKIESRAIAGTMSTTAALAAVTNLAASADGIQVTSDVADEPVNPPSTGPVTGLEQVFPFCLPFDFARFVGILSATRAAPEFDWIIPIPEDTGLGIEDQYIHIDLSDFDPAAEVLRTAELLAAAIGLILLTRDLLKW